MGSASASLWVGLPKTKDATFLFFPTLRDEEIEYPARLECSMATQDLGAEADTEEQSSRAEVSHANAAGTLQPSTAEQV